MFKVILYIILAIVSIIANYKFRNIRYKFTKPLPIFMLILLVGGSYLNNPNTYSLTILIGLIFCLGGDILLLFPDYFKAGLFSFLIGHFWYIGAFTTEVLVYSSPTILVIVLTAVFMITQLWNSSGKLRVPILIYIIVISAMVFTAWSHFYSVLTPLSQVAALGATLFMISDSILAWNRFKTPFKSAEGIILLTYYTGQYLIAHSAFH